MTQAILFLDIDGVIATSRAKLATGSLIDPVAVGILRKIVFSTGCRIVVTSTWRSSADTCQNLFTSHGLQDALWSPIGKQQGDWCIADGPRGMAIRAWLDAHPDITDWAILDDMLADFDQLQLSRLVHVDDRFGLGPADYSRAVRLLSGATMGHTIAHAPRQTLAAQAQAALDAIDQGDQDSAIILLQLIKDHPLAQ